ncbi:carboxymuconolactone decarboxylase family protein [Streptomyces sp. CWNU-52B]|uniref:carboxymuconolactone decarboxylase family protein n=1 Tax=unclassified Streptomyces TaxID=2593676 RepID=UPI0039BEDCD9
MNQRPAGDDRLLGGRLPLIHPASFDDAQRALHHRLHVTRVRGAEDAGYAAVLPDGRLIGPFNAMLRAPELAGPLLEWAQAIAGSGIPADVREVVVLTVAAQWRAEYVLYAHTLAAGKAGVPGPAVAALVRGEPPLGMRAEAHVAHRLAVALVGDHHVPQGLYDEAVTVFGTDLLVALVNLIGQYLNTSALLACFRVPAPSPHHTTQQRHDSPESREQPCL